ncbi:srg family chemoreceptor domain-containing protein [Ditylenchus destructor]|uniref:Serpentine receptor class gamma n=1 Tax=Ditylenchus destructor TaxID=166010 RepID=A0AAD4R313_9BILA|nr:srg family chemoreceptor domain-containing protein [Ditylenchus destructor]
MGQAHEFSIGEVPAPSDKMDAFISQLSYPSFVLSLIIGIPSVILYTIECGIFLVHRQKFGTAFFRLFIARFVCNFLNYFSSFLYARFGRVGLFIGFMESLPPLLLAIGFFFNYYSFHADNLSTAFILLNRLTLILFPTTHVKIWKYALPVSIVLIFLSPLPFLYETLGYDFYVRRQSDNWTYTLDYHKEEGKVYVRSVYLCAISAIFFCGICGALNILTIFFYRRNNRMIATKANSQRRQEHKIEAKLTVYAFYTFLAQLGIAVYMLLMYFSSNTPASANLFLATFNQHGLVVDVCTIVIPAWVLLWASPIVRREIVQVLKFCTCFCTKANANSTPTIALNGRQSEGHPPSKIHTTKTVSLKKVQTTRLFDVSNKKRAVSST